MSSKNKLLEYMLARVGKKLTARELHRASGGASEYGRRLRELRAEGWPIETIRDNSELRPNEWRLVSQKKGKPIAFSRGISKTTRARVLERNGFTCQNCGVAAGDTHPHNKRKAILQMGHIKDKSMGGSDTIDNLRAICSVCNEGAQNLAPAPPPLRELLVAVRRADMATQRKVLDWLNKRLNQPK